jgi:pentose-5-phosphate-3-epimerase
MAAEVVQQALQAVSEQIRQLQDAVKQQQPIVVPVGGGNRKVQMRKVNGGYEADILEG